MKISPVFSAALLTMLSCSPLMALSGGPVYTTPTDAQRQTGTYQAILRGENMMGVVIFGSTATPTANARAGEGLSALYFEGITVRGNCFGTASGTSGSVSAVFEASRENQGQISIDTVLNPNEIITFDVNDVVNGSGSFLADFEGNNSLNFTGSGECKFSLVKGLDVSPADPYVASQNIPFDVFGLKTSLSVPIFVAIPTVETPSVVASNVRADTDDDE